MSAATLLVDALTVDSALLGALEIRPESVVTFAAGLPGFQSLRRFALVETQRADAVWLQSIDDTDVTLLLVDPFAVAPGFAVEVPTADLEALGAPTDTDSLLVLAVAQFRNGVPAEANLQSPIVIRRDRCIGRQVVLPDSKFGMHTPITLD
jgi:flagellar assembly factor FliW